MPGKISELADAGVLHGDELLEVTDDPSGTPVSRSTSVDDIVARANATSGAFAPAALRLPRPAETVVSTFQSGHGFSVSGGSPGTTNDTTDFVIGTQSTSATTNGAGAQVSFNQSGMTPVNMTDKAVRIVFKVNDTTNLSAINLYAGDNNLANHHRWDFGGAGSTDNIPAGEWVEMTLSYQDAILVGTSPRSAITNWRVRVVDNSGGPVTFHLNKIAVVPEHPSEFPNGVVTVWFDDAFASAYSLGRPRLDLYGFPATAAVIADRVGLSGFCTLDQLRALQQVNGWEVAAHTHTLQAHTDSYTSMTAAAVETDMREMKRWLTANGFLGADTLSIPRGRSNPEVISLARKFFSAARTTQSRSKETLPPGDPMRMRAINVLNSTTTASLQTAIDNAYNHGGWLHIVFHNIAATASTTTDYSTANYNTVIDYLATKGIPVRTCGDVLSTLRASA